jgi:hypothetical protein
MIRKSTQRFSEKLVFNQKADVRAIGEQLFDTAGRAATCAPASQSCIIAPRH